MKKAIATSALGLVALGAHAQSSVTLYGIVDTGIGYQSSQTSLGSTSGGRSAIKMVNGIWAGSRFGLKGSEDLGGGTKAIFQLEEGFNSATGAQSVSRSGVQPASVCRCGQSHLRYVHGRPPVHVVLHAAVAV